MHKTSQTLGQLCEVYIILNQYEQILTTSLEMVSLFPEDALSYLYVVTAHYYLKSENQIILDNMTKSISLTSPSIAKISSTLISIRRNYIFYLKEFLIEYLLHKFLQTLYIFIPICKHIFPINHKHTIGKKISIEGRSIILILLRPGMVLHHIEFFIVYRFQYYFLTAIILILQLLRIRIEPT